MMSTSEHRRNRCAFPHVEGADTLEAIELVSSKRKQIDIEIIDVNRYFAHGLNCVSVKENSLSPGKCAHLGDRLDNPCFVIGSHDADENRFTVNVPAHIVGVDIGHTFLRSRPGMLGRHGDTPVAKTSLSQAMSSSSPVSRFFTRTALFCEVGFQRLHLCQHLDAFHLF
ncbi:MAG TPA: hypothetical protein VFG29_03190 [Syntrophales bacterium]|nr:hypothetical protein [Syntrophales bacterium]